MKTAELASAIGAIFGGPQVECLNGDFMGSIAESLGTPHGKNRWRPAGILRKIAADSSGSITFSREWPKVARDHSRARRGNRRP